MLWANDELFAEKENLIKPAPAEFRPATFGHKGQVYDGWETRRRRGATADSHDSAIVRLGVPGIVRGVVVDTAWFTGNYPPQISVEAAYVEGYPSVEELVDKTEWTTIVERRPVNGDTRNPFEVDSSRRWSHVRLSIYPDGGVARFRVHGEGLLGSATSPTDCRWISPRWRTAGESRPAPTCSTVRRTTCCCPARPGRWATGGRPSRRRDAGNDWVQVHLAGHGRV